MSRQAPPRFEDLNFAGAHLHFQDFEQARIADGHFGGAEISRFIANLCIDGVDVEPVIRAELEHCSPDSALLRANDPPGLAGGWEIVQSR